jgi:flagellar assembly factor FliW
MVNQVLIIFQPQGITGFDPIHSFRLSRVQNFLFSYIS